MIRYLLRRIGYGFLILIGVNLLTFMLFFTVNTPMIWRASISAASV